MYVRTGGISAGIDKLLYSKSGGRHNMYILKWVYEEEIYWQLLCGRVIENSKIKGGMHLIAFQINSFWRNWLALKRARML